jgi:hypothetical protein
VTFKPAIWFPIAVVLSAVNVAAVWFAAQPGEAGHATIHAGLALGFGLWAQRLRRGAPQLVADARLEELAVELDQQRLELSEAQERLDFAERVMAQRAEVRPGEPER